MNVIEVVYLRNYWIGVASLDHVEIVVNGGFRQLCHGKQQPLSRMKLDDWIIYYSPKAVFEGKTPLQNSQQSGR